MIRKKSLLLLLVFSLIAAMLLAACSPQEPAVNEGGDDPAVEPGEVAEGPSGTLIVGISEASGNFNPMYYSSSYDGYVVDLVFEKLADLNFNNEYEGVLAESWEYSEDGKSITFKLHEDHKFSDGEPVTADDVIFTYTVLSDPSYTGRYGSYAKDLLGYDAYYAQESEELPGIEKIDEYTVKFNFVDALRVNFENVVSMQIVPEHYYGVDFAYNNTAPVEAITTEALGSGPYAISEFKDKELIYLSRHDQYTGEGYMVQDIIMKFVDLTTDIVELTSGSVDMLAGVIEPQKIADARANGFSMNEYARSGYGYVKTNTEYGATADPLVRQALYYSFNVKEFVNSYYYDADTDQILANTQYHPFSQVSWAIDDALLAEMTEYDFDLEKAAALLDEAGWTLNAEGFREKDGEVLELKVAAMPDHEILATLIPMWERDWGQGLGIKLNVAYLEFNTLLDYVIYNSDANVEEWSLFFMATSITSPDPHSLYSEFHSSAIGSGKDNTSRYNNPEVDALFDQAKGIMDQDEAKPVYAEIAKILNEEAVMMPVYANTYFDIYNPKLVDLQTSSLYNWVKAMKDAKIVE